MRESDEHGIYTPALPAWCRVSDSDAVCVRAGRPGGGALIHQRTEDDERVGKSYAFQAACDDEAWCI